MQKIIYSTGTTHSIYHS